MYTEPKTSNNLWSDVLLANVFHFSWPDHILCSNWFRLPHLPVFYHHLNLPVHGKSKLENIVKLSEMLYTACKIMYYNCCFISSQIFFLYRAVGLHGSLAGASGMWKYHAWLCAYNPIITINVTGFEKTQLPRTNTNI